MTLTVEHLSKSYWEPSGRQRWRAVDDVSLTIEAGECLALIGESGCGKSTLGWCIAGLSPTDGGAIQIASQGRPAARSGRPSRVQMVFQDGGASLDPRMTIERNLAEAAGAAGVSVGHLLTLAEIPPELLPRFPHQLSGGQRQRVALARALAPEPDLLILDEPFSALDEIVRERIVATLERVRERSQLSVLVIEHDLGLVERMASRVAIMYLGRIVEIGQTAAVFAFPRHPYTRMLLLAAPRAGISSEQMPAGEIPVAWRLPVGCAFHPRCPRSTALCMAERPVLAAPKETQRRASGLKDRLFACHHPWDEPAADGVDL